MTASYRGQAWWWFIWDRCHARQLHETFQWGLKCLLCIVFLILFLEVSTHQLHYHGHHFIECAYSQTCFQAKLRNGLLLRRIIFCRCRLGKASFLTTRTKHIVIHSAMHAYLFLISFLFFSFFEIFYCAAVFKWCTMLPEHCRDKFVCLTIMPLLHMVPCAECSLDSHVKQDPHTLLQAKAKLIYLCR